MLEATSQQEVRKRSYALLNPLVVDSGMTVLADGLEFPLCISFGPQRSSAVSLSDSFNYII